MGGVLNRMVRAAGLLGGFETLPPLPVMPGQRGLGGRSRSRTKWSGADLRRIRAKGQTRECARRLRQRGARS
jgi:hypothetical protein